MKCHKIEQTFEFKFTFVRALLNQEKQLALPIETIHNLHIKNLQTFLHQK